MPLGGNMKISILICKAIVILGILWGLTSIQAWLSFEMSRFTLDYNLGFILLNVTPVLAYGLVGLLVTLGQQRTNNDIWWMVLGLVGLLVGLATWIVLDPIFLVKQHRMILEIWRVGGLLIGLLIGSVLTTPFLKTKKAE